MMQRIMMMLSCCVAMSAPAYAQSPESIQTVIERACAQSVDSPVMMDASILYAVTDCKQGSKPNFIMGTLHSSDAKVMQSIRFVTPYLEGSDAAWFELLEESNNPHEAMRLMFLPIEDKEGLRGLLGKEDFANFVALVQKKSPTLSEYHLTRYRPWAAAVMLQLLSIDTSGVVMDDWVQRQARNAKKPVQALETMKEQFGMFNAFSQDEQLVMLRDSMTQFESQEQQTQQMVAAYQRGNLQEVADIGQQTLDAIPDKALAEKLKNETLTLRNERMIKKMQKALQDGGQFVAVGALHLPYDDGLLALARKDGYRIIPVSASNLP